MKCFKKHPIILLLIGILGISLSSIFVKYSTAPSAVTAALRLWWTVFLSSPTVFGKRELRREFFSLPKKLVLLSAISGLLLAVHFVLWFESLSHTSVASSTAIVCTEVIWVALGFRFILKGTLAGKAILFIAITLLGSILIAFSDSGSGDGLYGDILSMLAAIAVAGYTLIGRVVRSKVSTAVYTYVVYVSCAVALAVTCLIQGYRVFGYGTSAVLVGLLLAVFSTILGHSIFSWCLKYFSPAFVSASKLCEPVVAALLASFLFREVPAPLQIIGGILTVCGVFFYSRQELSSNNNTKDLR